MQIPRNHMFIILLVICLGCRSLVLFEMFFICLTRASGKGEVFVPVEAIEWSQFYSVHGQDTSQSYIQHMESPPRIIAASNKKCYIHPSSKAENAKMSILSSSFYLYNWKTQVFPWISIVLNSFTSIQVQIWPLGWSRKTLGPEDEDTLRWEPCAPKGSGTHKTWEVFKLSHSSKWLHSKSFFVGFFVPNGCFF